MIIKFHSIKDKFPETWNILGMQVSTSLPVLTVDGIRAYATIWGDMWRESLTGLHIRDVTHWGEVIEE